MTEQELEISKVTALVGHHHRFNISVGDAIDAVQARCPEGWRAGAQFSPGNDLPAGAVRVGQVRVRQSDPAIPLYVYPIPAR